MVTTFGTSDVATSWAAARSLASRTSRLWRILAAWASTPSARHEGQPLGQEEVAAVAVGHVDDVALLADLGDVGPEHQLHDSSSSSCAPPRHRPSPRPRVGARRRRGPRRASLGGSHRLGVGSGQVALATATALAVALGAAGLGDAAGVGQQRHLAGVLDRPGDLGLLLRAVAGDAAGPDLGPVGHEPAEQVHVLPVDVLDALGEQEAHLLLGAASVVLVLGADGLGHQKGSSAGS